jgi:hypothetical protein
VPQRVDGHGERVAEIDESEPRPRRPLVAVELGRLVGVAAAADPAQKGRVVDVSELGVAQIQLAADRNRQ